MSPVSISAAALALPFAKPTRIAPRTGSTSRNSDSSTSTRARARGTRFPDLPKGSALRYRRRNYRPHSPSRGMNPNTGRRSRCPNRSIRNRSGDSCIRPTHRRVQPILLRVQPRCRVPRAHDRHHPRDRHRSHGQRQLRTRKEGPTPTRPSPRFRSQACTRVSSRHHRLATNWPLAIARVRRPLPRHLNHPPQGSPAHRLPDHQALNPDAWIVHRA